MMYNNIKHTKQKAMEHFAHMKTNSQLVPEGVNEKYFWILVDMESGSHPGGKELYKSGRSYLETHHKKQMSSGVYQSYIDSAIKSAQRKALDPDSDFTQKDWENRPNMVFTRKRDMLAKAYGKNFPEEQTHAKIKGERTRLD